MCVCVCVCVCVICDKFPILLCTNCREKECMCDIIVIGFNRKDVGISGEKNGNNYTYAQAVSK